MTKAVSNREISLIKAVLLLYERGHSLKKNQMLFLLSPPPQTNRVKLISGRQGEPRGTQFTKFIRSRTPRFLISGKMRHAYDYLWMYSVSIALRGGGV